MAYTTSTGETIKDREYCQHPLNRGRGTAIKKIARKKPGRGIWPPPVYEAHMSDGEVIRMSFWAPFGRPISPDRGRALILSCTNVRPSWRKPVERGGLPWSPPVVRYGAVHHDGQVIVDEAVLADVQRAA